MFLLLTRYHYWSDNIARYDWRNRFGVDLSQASYYKCALAKTNPQIFISNVHFAVRFHGSNLDMSLCRSWFSESEITFCKPPYYVDQKWVRRITPCISTPILLFGRAKYQLRMEVVIAVWQCWPNLGVSWAGVWIFRKTRVLAMCEENRLAETQSGGGSNGVNQWHKFSQRPWGETKAIPVCLAKVSHAVFECNFASFQISEGRQPWKSTSTWDWGGIRGVLEWSKLALKLFFVWTLSGESFY